MSLGNQAVKRDQRTRCMRQRESAPHFIGGLDEASSVPRSRRDCYRLVFAAVGAARPSVIVVVFEHAVTDKTTDTGKKGDSAGDILTFANPIYDGADKLKVGTDNGFCVRTVPGVAYECWWTTFLPKGQITVEGPYYDKKPSVLAITGGTGAYANARGWMALNSKAGGTQYDFVFHIA